MDPIIQEMSQARPPIRPDVYFRWVEHLQRVVQGKLDAYEELVTASEAKTETKGKR